MWYWKTPQNHRYLWINLTVVVAQDAAGSPRNGFRWRGRPMGDRTALQTLRAGEFSAGKRDLYQCCGGHSVLARLFRLSRSFALGTGLLSSLRSCPVLGRDFVNPSHPRAIEKCGGGREGEYDMA